ncbi:hypothetical protein PybrP1_004920 [[Pythium] brassicae (nom. inval.)]|nr:hypothetical protein PybrP1_004920 [[Pythium] brassicae (nom. inval.)]
MKFPTTERVLPELALSDAERQNFSSLARALVDTTVAEFLEYDRLYQRQVSPEQWKAVKRREALTVYKEPILRQALPFCTSCVARASQTSALKIAGDEVRSGRWDTNRVAPDNVDGPAFTARFERLQLRGESVGTSSFVSESDRETSSGNWTRTVSFATSEGSVGSSRHSPVKARQHRQLSTASEISVNASERESDDKPPVNPLMWTHGANQTSHTPRAEASAPAPTLPADSAVPVDPHQRLLYLQITQLREAAENVYQIAMANAAAMHTHQSTLRTSE